MQAFKNFHYEIIETDFRGSICGFDAFLYANAQDKPNILVIWGDDIGWFNISANNMWLFVPAQDLAAQFLESFKEFPPVQGGSLSVDKVVQQLQSQPSRN